MRWTSDAAWHWYRRFAPVCGVNYVPSTAVNTTEMWQGETFDPATITRELGWAASLGLNCCRVFLQYLVWEADPAGVRARLDQFLAIAAGCGLRTILCLFDDCAFSGKQPFLGPQDAPRPGLHNSAWTPSPGHARVTDPAAWPRLRAYVTAIIRAHRDDPRVLLWDLYNEPGNAGMDARSLPLVRETFAWARAARPTQPITGGAWDFGSPVQAAYNDWYLAESDVITFHNYGGAGAFTSLLPVLRAPGRPLICTEWMRRPACRVADLLPFFTREEIGWVFWGLVNGKTQTHYPWDSPAGAPEPPLWFHDIYRADGSPYLPEELELLRAATHPPAVA